MKKKPVNPTILISLVGNLFFVTLGVDEMAVEKKEENGGWKQGAVGGWGMRMSTT